MLDSVKVQEQQVTIIRLSDPGLHPKTVEITPKNAKALEAALKEATQTGYTSACVTVRGQDYWLERPVGCELWLTFVFKEALELEE